MRSMAFTPRCACAGAQETTPSEHRNAGSPITFYAGFPAVAGRNGMKDLNNSNQDHANLRQRLRYRLKQGMRHRRYAPPVTRSEQTPPLPPQPHTSRTIIRIEDLIGSKIITADGRKLGHVVDIHVTRKPDFEEKVWEEEKQAERQREEHFQA